MLFERQRTCKYRLERATGGGGGIRTHGTISRTPVFKTGALNRSATPPHLNEADLDVSLSLSNSSVNLPLAIIRY